uniref:Secreted protein n=1 Tax=Anopheles culicifacies TaxID=139723 RepID=A0A182MCJ5_9DIPT
MTKRTLLLRAMCQMVAFQAFSLTKKSSSISNKVTQRLMVVIWTDICIIETTSSEHSIPVVVHSYSYSSIRFISRFSTHYTPSTWTLGLWMHAVGFVVTMGALAQNKLFPVLHQ